MEKMTLDDFVGQEQIKKTINFSVASSLVKKSPFPHTMMFGPPGLGKTTIAKIISEEMGCKIYSYLATSINSEAQIEAILCKLDNNGYNLDTGDIEGEIKPEIIFIDEIHNLKRSVTEMLHTVLENNEITIKKRNYISGMVEPTVCWVPRFCLIGATNYLGDLPKPFRDRFSLVLNFEIYSDEEICSVIKGFAEKTGCKINDNAVFEIAKRSRGTPRIAISFFKQSNAVAVSVENDAKAEISIEHVMYMFNCEGIDSYGLNRLDRKVIKYLSTMSRPIGAKALAQAVDEDSRTVETVIEPYLVRIGYLARTGSGRYLTDEGRNSIQQEKRSILYPKR